MSTVKKVRAWLFCLKKVTMPNDKNLLFTYFIKPCKSILRSIMILEKVNDEENNLRGYVQFRYPRTQGENAKYDERIIWEACVCSPRDAYKRFSESPDVIGGPWTCGTFEKILVKPKKSLMEKLLTKEIPKQKLLRKYGQHLLQLDPLLPYILDCKSENIWESRRMEDKSVVCFWGASGVGKTGRVYNLHPGKGEVYLVWNCKFPFFMYNQEEVVLFDNFNGWLDYNYLLQLTHRYPLKFYENDKIIYWCPKKIYFTSTVDPMNWYPNCEQLLSRFTNIMHMELNIRSNILYTVNNTQDDTTTSTSETSEISSKEQEENEKKENTELKTIFDPSWFLESPPINLNFQDYFYFIFNGKR